MEQLLWVDLGVGCRIDWSDRPVEGWVGQCS